MSIIILIIAFFVLICSGIIFQLPILFLIISFALSSLIIGKLFIRLRQTDVFNSNDIDIIRTCLKYTGILSAISVFVAWVLFRQISDILSSSTFIVTFLSFLWLGVMIGLILESWKAPSEESVYNRELAQSIQDSKNHELQKIVEIYRGYKQAANIPTKASVIEISKNCPHLGILAGEHYIWIDNDNLCLFPYIRERSSLLKREMIYPLISIPKNRIEYFSIDGEIYRENKISGGGGGGSSVSGAIIGGIIAGDAGAIIGSRKKTEEIKSELITHDTRAAYINIFDANEQRFSLWIKFNYVSVLQELLPEKEFSIVDAIRRQNIIQKELHRSKPLSPGNVSEK